MLPTFRWTFPICNTTGQYRRWTVTGALQYPPIQRRVCRNMQTPLAACTAQPPGYKRRRQRNTQSCFHRSRTGLSDRYQLARRVFPGLRSSSGQLFSGTFTTHWKCASIIIRKYCQPLSGRMDPRKRRSRLPFVYAKGLPPLPHWTGCLRRSTR